MLKIETSRNLKPWPDYRAVWRWHFYAGLFCIPFVILLSITGTIYLFKAEIEAWLERPYDRLIVNGQPEIASRQIRAAMAAVPGSTFQGYELPQSLTDSVRVIVNQGGKAKRVYLHPQTLDVLQSIWEESRFMRFIFKIHGELLMGNRGSAIVELASSWAIIMILTGLYLWWPRGANRLGGILYPRLSRGSRIFWRDIHSVTGFWVSGLALFLLLTGLPWAKFWGDYFKQVRRLTGTAVARQDWTNGASPLNEKVLAAVAGNRDQRESKQSRGFNVRSVQPEKRTTQPVDLASVDLIVATLKPMGLLAPVVIAPPGVRSFEGKSVEWTAKSMTANRPRRVDLVMDGTTGAIKSRKDFKDRYLIDQIVGTGVAAHEGRLFGWPNQLLGLITALGLILLCISSVILWVRRREPGSLGAPVPAARHRMAWAFIMIVLILGICLPLFGFSLISVLLLDRFILRRIPGVARWLGLSSKSFSSV